MCSGTRRPPTISAPDVSARLGHRTVKNKSIGTSGVARRTGGRVAGHGGGGVGHDDAWRAVAGSVGE